MTKKKQRILLKGLISSTSDFLKCKWKSKADRVQGIYIILSNIKKSMEFNSF